MEEDILDDQPDLKIYKENSISLATFFGGPLVGGYLIAENFKSLGEPSKAKTTWIITISATCIIFAAIFLIPAMEKLPNFLIPIIYYSIVRTLVKNFQSASIKNHIESGGETYSNWRVVWVSLVGVLVLFAIILVLVLLKERNT